MTRPLEPTVDPLPDTAPVIDLGEVGALRSQSRHAPPVRPARRARQRPPWSVAALAVLVLALVGGASAQVGPARPVLVQSMPLGRLIATRVTDGVLYLAQAAPVDTDDNWRGDVYGIGAHRLIPLATGHVDLIGTYAGTALISQNCADPSTALISGVDIRTGRRRWARAGLVVLVNQGYLLMRPTGGRDCPPGGATTAPVPLTGDETVAVVDIVTGRALWTMPYPQTAAATTTGSGGGGSVPILLAVTPDGMWMRRDLRTGAVLPPVGVPARLRDRSGADGAAGGTIVGAAGETGIYSLSLFAWPGIVIASTITYVNPDNTSAVRAVTLRAFDATTLRPLWSLTSGGADAFGAGMFACGPAVCLTGSGGTVALAAGTGDVAWRDPWQVVRLVGSHWALIMPPAELSALTPRTQLIDLAGSGRPVADLTGWRITSPDAVPPQWPGRAGPAVVYRTAGGRTWFARLDPDRGVLAPHVIASVGQFAGSCRPASDYVACTSGGRLVVWRLPA